MSAFNGFQRGSGAYKCSECGKRTRETGAGESGVDLCKTCFDLASRENEHLDGHHSRPGFARIDCPRCVTDALNIAAKTQRSPKAIVNLREDGG